MNVPQIEIDIGLHNCSFCNQKAKFMYDIKLGYFLCHFPTSICPARCDQHMGWELSPSIQFAWLYWNRVEIDKNFLQQILNSEGNGF